MNAVPSPKKVANGRIETAKMHDKTQLKSDLLDEARRLIIRDYGSLRDLPKDVRNTIANIYYDFARIRREAKDKNPFPGEFREERNFEDGLKRFGENVAHVFNCVENLPMLVRSIRDAKAASNNEVYRLGLRGFRYMVKYRIPNVDTKSELRVMIEALWYRTKVNEIPDLWRLVENE